MSTLSMGFTCEVLLHISQDVQVALGAKSETRVSSTHT